MQSGSGIGFKSTRARVILTPSNLDPSKLPPTAVRTERARHPYTPVDIIFPLSSMRPAAVAYVEGEDEDDADIAQTSQSKLMTLIRAHLGTCESIDALKKLEFLCTTAMKGAIGDEQKIDPQILQLFHARRIDLEAYLAKSEIQESASNATLQASTHHSSDGSLHSGDNSPISVTPEDFTTAAPVIPPELHSLFAEIGAVRTSLQAYEAAIARQNRHTIYQDMFQAVHGEPLQATTLGSDSHARLLAIPPTLQLENLGQLRKDARKDLLTVDTALRVAKCCLILNEALPFLASIDFPNPVTAKDLENTELCDQIYFLYHYATTLNVLPNVMNAIEAFLTNLSNNNLALIKKNITAIAEYVFTDSARCDLPGIIRDRHPGAIKTDPDFMITPVTGIIALIDAAIDHITEACASTAAQPAHTISDTDFQAQMHQSTSALHLYPSLPRTAYIRMDECTAAEFHDRRVLPTLNQIIFATPQLPAIPYREAYITSILDTQASRQLPIGILSLNQEPAAAPTSQRTCGEFFQRMLSRYCCCFFNASGPASTAPEDDHSGFMYSSLPD